MILIPNVERQTNKQVNKKLCQMVKSAMKGNQRRAGEVEIARGGVKDCT